MSFDDYAKSIGATPVQTEEKKIGPAPRPINTARDEHKANGTPLTGAALDLALHKKPSTKDSLPSNKMPHATRLAVVAVNRPDLTNNVSLPEDGDMHSFIYNQFHNSLNGETPQIQKDVEASLAREKIAASKKAKEVAIGSLPDGSPLKEQLVGEWQTLSVWEQADNDVLFTQGGLFDAVENIAFMESNLPLGAYGQFADRMDNVRMNHKVAAVNQAARYLSGYAEDLEVFGDTSVFYDAFESIVLPMFRGGMLTSEMLDDDEYSIFDYFLPGTAKYKVARQAFENADDATKREVGQEIIDGIRVSMGDKAAFGISNDIEGWTTALEINDSLDEQLNGDDSVDWSRWTEDAFGLMSWVAGPLGGVAKGMYKAGKLATQLMGVAGYKGVYNQALLSTAEQTSKDLSRVLKSETSNEGLKNLGTSRKNLLDQMLPVPADPGTKVVGDGAQPVASRNLSDIAVADAIVSNEKAVQFASTPMPRPIWDIPDPNTPEFKKRALFQLKQFGTHINLNQSLIGDVDRSAGTFKFKAFIGLDPTRGFDSFGTALDAKASWKMEGASIYKYDAKSDAYIPVNPMEEASTARGEYYLVDEMDVTMGQEMAPFLSDTLAKDTWRFTEYLGNWATTGMRRYTDDMRLVFNNLQRTQASETRLFDDIIAPYAALDDKSKKVVGKLIYENNGKKTFQPSELLAMGLTEQETVGYLAFRNANDAMLGRLNKLLKQNADQAGKKRLHIKELSKDHLVTPFMHYDAALAAFRSDASKVLDTSTGEYISLSGKASTAQTKLWEEYSNGNYIVRLDNPEIAEDGEEIVWALVRASDDKAKLTGVPENMLKAVPGYVPRFVDHKYGVYITSPVFRDGKMTGKSAPKLIKYASSLAEADKYAKAMNTSAKKGEVFTGAALPDVSKAWDGADLSLFEAENLMFYQKRSEELEAIDSALAYVTPDQALNRLSSSVATVTSAKLLENYEKNWLRSYGHLFKDTSVAFPTLRSVLDNTKPYEEVLAGNARLAEKAKKGEYSQAEYFAERDRAIAGWDWYNIFVAGPTRSDTKMAKFFGERVGLSLARATGTFGAPKRMLGNWLVETPDATKMLRTAAYFHQIASVPFKQMLINAPTLAVWTGKDPLGASKAVGVDATYLSLHYLANKKAQYADSMTRLNRLIANTHGALAPDDYKAMAKAFNERGVGEMHAVSANMARNGFGDETQAAIQSVWQRGKEFITELGPAPAERFVAASAFSFATRQVSKELGKAPSKFTNDDWMKVVDQTAQSSFNMTKVDSYNWQRGTFGMMMQYASVRVKALQYVAFSKELTPLQKGGSAAALLTLFGAEGVGMKETVDFIWESSGLDWDKTAAEIKEKTGLSMTGEELRMKLHGGTIDAAWNSMMDAMFAEEGNNVNVSQSVSPFAGLDRSVYGLSVGLSAILTGDTELLGEAYMGASGAIASNYGNMIHNIAQAVADPAITTQEGLDTFVRDASMLTSGSANAVKAWEGYALKSMVNRSGDPIAEATLGQLFSQGVFGLSNQETDDYYAGRLKSSFDKNGRPKEGSDMETLAKEHANFLFSSSDWQDMNKRFARIIKLKAAVMESDPATAEAYGRALDFELSRRNDEAATRFWRRMAEQIKQQKKNDPEYLLGVMKNTDYALRNPVFRQEIETLEAALKSKTITVGGKE